MQTWQLCQQQAARPSMLSACHSLTRTVEEPFCYAGTHPPCPVCQLDIGAQPLARLHLLLGLMQQTSLTDSMCIAGQDAGLVPAVAGSSQRPGSGSSRSTAPLLSSAATRVLPACTLSYSLSQHVPDKNLTTDC